MENTAPVKEGTLDAIYSMDEVTLTGGRKVKVSRMKVRHVKKALDLIRAIVKGFLTTGIEVSTTVIADVAGNTVGIKPEAILQLISNNYDEAFALVGFHVDIPEEELLELDLEDGLLIVSAVVRINADFFTRRVLPLLLEMAASVEMLESPLTKAS